MADNTQTLAERIAQVAGGQPPTTLTQQPSTVTQQTVQTPPPTSATPPTIAPTQGSLAQRIQQVAATPNPTTPPTTEEKPGYFKGLYDMTVGPAVDLVQKEFHAYTDPVMHPIDYAMRKKEVSDKAADELKQGNYGNAVRILVNDLEHDNPLLQVAHGIASAHISEGQKTIQELGTAYDSTKNAISDIGKGDVGQLGTDAQNANAALTSAIGHGAATLVPAIGPAAAKVGEDFETNPTYAGGELTGLLGSVLAPEAVKLGKGAVANRLSSSALTDATEAGVDMSLKQGITAAAKENPVLQKFTTNPAATQTAQLVDTANKISEDIHSNLPKNASPTEVGQAMNDAIQTTKNQIGSAFDVVDKQITEAGGDALKIPAKGMKGLRGFVNSEIDDAFPQSKRPGFEPTSTELNARQQLLSATDPTKPLSFEEARQVRQQLFRTAESGELTDVQQALVRRVAGKLNDEMQGALDANPAFKDLAAQRRAVGANYQAFNDALDRGMLRGFFESENGKVVLKAGKDPEALGAYIVKNASPTTAAQLRTLMGSNFSVVQDAVWRNIWQQALEKGGDVLSSKTLRQLWDGLGQDTQKAIYGDKPELLARQQKVIQVSDALDLGLQNKWAALAHIGEGVGKEVTREAEIVGAIAKPMLALKVGPVYLTVKLLSKLMNAPGGADVLIRALKAPAAATRAAATASLANFVAAQHVKEISANQDDEEK